MHFHAYAAVAQMLQLVPTPTRVLEIGSLDINGSVRNLFAGADYTGIDVVPGPGVDTVADGADYEPPVPPDCVVCCEVLEHTTAAARIVQHAADIVAPGGSVIVTCAGPERTPHSAVDGGPLRDGEWYCNIKADCVRKWMEHAGLHVLECQERQDRGDVYACGVKPCAS